MLQAYITDNLYAEQLREVPSIVRPPPLVDAEGNAVDAATYVDNFIDFAVARAIDVGDLSSGARAQLYLATASRGRRASARLLRPPVRRRRGG
eukprot:SAG22_NODE_7821_length_705_cov_0.844884_1_plen_93_part_00